jgi:hypothetical protein
VAVIDARWTAEKPYIEISKIVDAGKYDRNHRLVLTFRTLSWIGIPPTVKISQI